MCDDHRMTKETADGWVVVEGPAAGFAQTIRAGKHGLVADEPEEVGGTDTGLSPHRLVAAALGACTSMTLAMYARRKEWPLEHVRVRVLHSHLPAGSDPQGPAGEMRREIELTGALTDEQRARLLDIADKCPVHKTLTRGLRIETKLA